MSDVVVETTARARAHETARFNERCFRAANILNHAATIATHAGLGSTRILKARAAAVLAGTLFYQIRGSADKADILRLRDDLEAIIKAIDPLIAAIGEEAACNTPGSKEDDRAEFKAVLGNAAEGNLLHILDCWANDVADAINNKDEIAARRSDHKRTLLQEAE